MNSPQVLPKQAPLALRIGEFVAQIRYEGLPASTVVAVKRLLQCINDKSRPTRIGSEAKDCSDIKTRNSPGEFITNFLIGREHLERFIEDN